MNQTAIPFLFMRGGSSRGPYFRREDLPLDEQTLSRVLVAVLGSGHRYNIDGIGGGVATTTKVAMLSRSGDGEADIDYLFAQVSVEDRTVDYRPTCGNIMAGVGPAAIEMGLVPATRPTTVVRIRAVNTGALIEARVETPEAEVEYSGATRIDGVPGEAAPVRLLFRQVVGSATGKLLPTGLPLDRIEGVPVSCVDVAIPVVFARASDFGLSGHESAGELDGNAAFAARREAIRVAAGERMGLGDVSGSVTPKFAILAPPRRGGTLAARYFMPLACHPSYAVTGGQCTAACALIPGSVAAGLCGPATDAIVAVEHPSGRMDLAVSYRLVGDMPEIEAVGLVRTARLLARGHVMVPAAVWMPEPGRNRGRAG